LDRLVKNKCYKIISIDRKTVFYGFQIIIIVEGGVEIHVPSLKTHPRFYESLSLYWELKKTVDNICIKYVDYRKIEFVYMLKDEIN